MKGMTLETMGFILIALFGVLVLIAFITGSIGELSRNAICFFYQNILSQDLEICGARITVVVKKTIKPEDSDDLARQIAAHSILCWEESVKSLKTKDTYCYSLSIEGGPFFVSESTLTNILEEEGGCNRLENAWIVEATGSYEEYEDCGYSDQLRWEVGESYVISDQKLILIKYDDTNKQIVVKAGEGQVTSSTIGPSSTTTTVSGTTTSTIPTFGEGELGCRVSFDDPKTYDGFKPESPFDFYDSYSNDPLKEIVDDCIGTHPTTKIHRVDCIIDWSYYYLSTRSYDFNIQDPDIDSEDTCWCVRRHGLRPNDVVKCAENFPTFPSNFPSSCGGCGVCVDFASTLYSMLITCGTDCDIDYENLYLVGGCLVDPISPSSSGCIGCHSWLLYEHPNHGWVFVDPTMPDLTSSLASPGSIYGFLFGEIKGGVKNYPCITFFIENLDKSYRYSTPDGLIKNSDCISYGVNLKTCPGS